MNKYIYNIGLLLIVTILVSACNDNFGKKLFGPEYTIDNKAKQVQEVSFISLSDGVGSSVTADISTPIDYVFSIDDPIGSSGIIKTSLFVVGGKALCDNNFTVYATIDQELLTKYEDIHGYKVYPLPEDCFKIETDIISLHKDNSMASTQSVVKIYNRDNLIVNRDYLLFLHLGNVKGYSTKNNLICIHIKRKGGSGDIEGAAVFMPSKGDDVLDQSGVDLGINRNNLYYTLENHRLSDLDKFTIEGLIYVDKFKDASEQINGTLAGISSVWGYESSGSDPVFLLRFGDASVKPDQLQLIINGDKKVINYRFKERKWYHIAITFDENKVLRFYVNGRSKFEFVSDKPIYIAKNTPFNLGQSFNQWRGFNGMMSQVRIWKTVRNAKDLRKNAIDLINYNDDKEDIVAYWKMNKVNPENTNVLEDCTGNGNDLIVKRSGALSEFKPKVIINNKIDIKL